MTSAQTGARASRSASTSLALDQIQGNIVGFLKDYQTFLFLRFPDDQELAQQWLRGVIGDVATCANVLDFNNLFKRIKARSGREGTIKATWVNIAFTHKGLVALNPDIPGLGD